MREVFKPEAPEPDPGRVFYTVQPSDIGRSSIETTIGRIPVFEVPAPRTVFASPRRRRPYSASELDSSQVSDYSENRPGEVPGEGEAAHE